MSKITGFIDEKHEADDDPPPSSLPCVRPKRPRVYVQNVPVYAGTTRTCVSTCGRGAGTHGDVLNVHTGTFFQCVTPHTTPHTLARPGTGGHRPSSLA